MMADKGSSGIVKQFPGKFNEGRPRQGKRI
jgi:hypothetical protein